MAERFQYPVQAAIDPEALAVELRDEIQWFQEFSVPVLRPVSVVNFPSVFIDPEALSVVERDVSQEWFRELDSPALPRHQDRSGWYAVDPETLAEALRDEIQWFREFDIPVLPAHVFQRAETAPIDPHNLGLPGEVTIQLVGFDGTNDELARGADLTGNADGKVGTVSFWVDFREDDTTLQLYTTSDGQGGFFRQSDNTIRFLFRGTDAAIKLDMKTSNTYTVSSGRVHVLASWDLANNRADIYVNDVSDVAGAPTKVDANIDYTAADHFVGHDTSAVLLNGCLGQLYINLAEYLDIAIEENRRRFISAALLPVDLGADGSLPTGTAPIMFFDGALATWETNDGTGGGFTLTGVLANCGEFPDTANIEQWWRPLSQPVQQHRQIDYAAALAASGASPIDPVTLDAALRDEIQWFREFQVPFLRRPSLAQIPAFFIDPVALDESLVAEVVTLDEFAPLSEPTRLETRQQPEPFVTDPATLDAAPRDELQWFREFSLPVLRRPSVANLPAFFVDTETLGEALRDELQWYRPLAEPTRRIVEAIGAGNIHVDVEPFAPPPEDLGDLDWFMPFSRPGEAPQSFAHLLAAASFAEAVVRPVRHEGLLKTVGRFMR